MDSQDPQIVEDLIVYELVAKLNDLLKEYDCGYSETIHEKIVNKFNDIAEKTYRKYLCKFR